MKRLPFSLCGALLIVLAGAPLTADKKKDQTQILEVPPDPPPAVVAETRRLVFHTSPLTAKGLLSQQTREAIRAILKDNGGNQIVKIRAFVSGTGDVRRVPQIVSETFAEKKHLQLPAVTVVQAGGLPLEGAQVVLESISVTKRDVNPLGLFYVSAQERSVPQPLQPLAPLAEQSLDAIGSKLNGRGEVLRLTCFVTILDDAARIAASMAAKFPGAALNLVETQRASARSSVACEAVARATVSVTPSEPGMALVTADRIVLTGSQIAYGLRDDDARLAFRRLDRVLGSFGASFKTAQVLESYPLSGSIAAQIARLKPEFLDAARPAIGASIPWESLPGMDSAFALEAVAPAGNVINQ